MTTQTASTKQNRWIGGAVMIAIGLMLFMAQIVKDERIGFLLMPVLGLFFIAMGIGTRNSGIMVPGGILSGLGTGLMLVSTGTFNEMASGSIILLSLALGFIAIIPLTAIVGGKVQLWPLIPGGFIGLTGGVLLAGEFGLQVLTLLGFAWPVFLIATGAFVILRAQR